MTTDEIMALADWLDDLFDADGEPKKAAAELRRLHDENEALRKALRNLFSYANRLEMNDAGADGAHPAMQEARAAMKGQP